MSEQYTLAINTNIKSLRLLRPLLVHINGTLIKEVLENGRQEIEITSKDNIIEARTGFAKSNSYKFSFTVNNKAEINITDQKQNKAKIIVFSLIVVVSLIVGALFNSRVGAAIGGAIAYIIWTTFFLNIEIRGEEKLPQMVAEK
ncbi:MAG: hypothetical protein ACYDBT_15855 [Desulfobulbaceae bacterium]